MKIPKADRYKTVALKTTDIDVARERAFDQDADIRFRLKHDVPVFNHPFREVGRDYLLGQEARAKRGEISAARPKKLRAIIEGALDKYVGSTQVHLIGDEFWGGYPAWRRENGAGRNRRNGVREISDEMAQAFANHEAECRTKTQHSLGIRVLKPIEVKPSEERTVPFSDSTIRFEISIFGAVMNYAIKKRYVPASQRFDEKPKLVLHFPCDALWWHFRFKERTKFRWARLRCYYAMSPQSASTHATCLLTRRAQVGILPAPPI